MKMKYPSLLICTLSPVLLGQMEQFFEKPAVYFQVSFSLEAPSSPNIGQYSSPFEPNMINEQNTIQKSSLILWPYFLTSPNHVFPKSEFRMTTVATFHFCFHNTLC